MIDLHIHSIFSDGELIPSEIVQRSIAMGYRALAITDHGDHSNIDFIVPRIVKVCETLSGSSGIPVIPGIELTHVRPEHISSLTQDARSLGAKLVIVHGETIVEPVISGTNRAALLSSIDILAHPGLITEEDAILAAHNGIYLEITTRRGHCLTNGHVVRMARRAHAHLVLNTDSHAPQDLTNKEKAFKIALGAGMTVEEVEIMFKNSEILIRKALER